MPDIPKCAAHGVKEIHALILAVMILVHLAETHEYSKAITLEVKHIVVFGRIFIFLANIYTRINLVFAQIFCMFDCLIVGHNTQLKERIFLFNDSCQILGRLEKKMLVTICQGLR